MLQNRLLLGKPVICLQNSGGTAEVFSKLKKGEVKIPLEVDTELIKPFDSITDIINYLSKETAYSREDNER